ncbi:hypothetical protein [Fusobacterium pseudoperiodonticum]|uniref:hypothetical protein n=1 Tax=Fusobacterium pseudoperiodonticum TaxID=2663009 RepID=UPI0038994546
MLTVKMDITSFKPCYKWIIIIKISSPDSLITCFKPCYKWTAFNTISQELIQGLDKNMF